MKRFLSVLLAAALLLTAFGGLSGVFAASGRVCGCEHTPMIYVLGRQEIFDDPSSPNRRALSGYDAMWMKDMMFKSYEHHQAELNLGIYNGFCDEIVEQFAERYREFVCDENGELPNNRSGVDWSWSPQTLRDAHREDNPYAYSFSYDGRKDPFEIADELNAYVEAVRRVTGHRRVAILSRCMGTEMALAYFEKYGWKDIDTFFSYSSAALGATIFSELFAGLLNLDLECVGNYLTEQHAQAPDAPEDPDIRLVRTLLEALQQLHALGLPSAVCNALTEKVRTNALPRMLKASFATAPGYWSMVAPADYARAKTFLFWNEGGKYAKLIEKLDAYDARVRRPMRTILNRMKADGVKLCFLAKYGFQLIPLTESRRTHSDDKITMEAQSFGATAATFGDTLSTAHIAAQELLGKGRYLSPDRCIDASTAWFPDTTWFVKNIRHNDFPSKFHEFVMRLIRSDRQLTVEDDPAYPQFLVFYRENGAEHWDPMTPQDRQTQFARPDFFRALAEFRAALRDWLVYRLFRKR